MSRPLPISDLLPSEEVDYRPKTILVRIWEAFSSLLFLLDAIAIFASLFSAYYLRFFAEVLVVKKVPIPDIGFYIRSAVILAIIWLILLWREGEYKSGFRAIDSPILNIKRIAMNGFFAMSGLMAISFLDREMLLSRQVYLMTYVLACCGMLVLRLGIQFVNQISAKRGFVSKRAVIVGSNSQTAQISQVFSDHKSIIKAVGNLSWARNENITSCDPKYLGTIQDIKSIYNRIQFDVLILSEAFQRGSEASSLADFMTVLNFCEEKQITVYTVPNSYSVSVRQSEVGSIAGMPILRLQDASLNAGYAYVKRIMDLILAGFASVLGLPLWLLIAILLRCTSRGPVIYSQVRAGLHGKPFMMYKFRSMVVDAENKLKDYVNISSLKEPVFKIRNDPRITPLGRILRRSSLDEIPQLINVLKGEMSLIGPRPEEMALVKRYEPLQRRRLKAKPGITGYQQVHSRGGASLEERIKQDLFYLKHQSILLDLYILIKTIVVVIRGDGTTH